MCHLEKKKQEHKPSSGERFAIGQTESCGDKYFKLPWPGKAQKEVIIMSRLEDFALILLLILPRKCHCKGCCEKTKQKNPQILVIIHVGLCDFMRVKNRCNCSMVWRHTYTLCVNKSSDPNKDFGKKALYCISDNLQRSISGNDSTILGSFLDSNTNSWTDLLHHRG